MIAIRHKDRALIPSSGCFLALLLLTSTAQAQAPDRYDIGLGFQAGAAIEASVVQADNYFYESSDGVSATGYLLRPEISLARAGSLGSSNLNLFLEQSNFDLRGKLDSYLDYGLNGQVLFQPYTRHRFDLTGGFRRDHDPVGLQRTEAGSNFSDGEIDRWNQTNAQLTYRYGAPNSLGNNTLSLGHTQRRYTTNRDETVFLDFQVRAIGYELAFEYTPKTALVFGASHRSTDYERPQLSTVGSRNGNELSLRGGLRWIATGKTSGEIQLGVREYSVDGRRRPAKQSLAWRANVNWRPVSLTEIRLTTGQTTLETFRADTFFIDERNVALNWRQTWSPRFSTDTGARYTDSRFVGSGRKDNYVSADVRGDYLLARGFSVFAQYRSRNRDSTLPGRDYSAPEARLGLRLSL